jgi:hypothetical protein
VESIFIENPTRIERQVSQMRLDADAARFLDHVTIAGRTVKRANGCCRPNFAGEEATNVNGACCFVLSGGVKLLAWSTAAGAWNAQTAITSANRNEDY